MTQRSVLEQRADVLRKLAEQPRKKTELMERSHVNFNTLIPILHSFEKAELVRLISPNNYKAPNENGKTWRQDIYAITNKGRMLLVEFNRVYMQVMGHSAIVQASDVQQVKEEIERESKMIPVISAGTVKVGELPEETVGIGDLKRKKVDEEVKKT